MEKNLLKIESTPCPEKLEEEILASIQSAQNKKVKIKLGLFGFSFLGIAGICVAMFLKILSDIQGSVFYEYASIIFSDTKFAFMNWKTTSLLLLESAPILDLFLIFLLSGLLLFLLSKTTREASLFFKPKLIYK